MPYIKEVFDVVTIDHAKHVVLTSDPANPNKFQEETDFLINKIIEESIIPEGSKVLDFGCGMGRISKELVHRLNCHVIGVDISDSMLNFAKLYVRSLKKFETKNSYLIPNSVDAALAILVLQHVENPEQEIENIFSCIKPGGYFVLLNEHVRYVPSSIDKNNFIVWNDDRYDVVAKAKTLFTEIKQIDYVSSDKKIFIFQKP